MLVNISGGALDVKVNGKLVSMAPEGNLDVRDCEILQSQVQPMEKWLMRKYSGKFKQVDSNADTQIGKEYKKQVDSLKATITEQKRVIDSMTDKLAEAAEKNASDANEIQGFGEKERSYKAQISSLKAEIKELKEDHDTTMNKIRGGRTK